MLMERRKPRIVYLAWLLLFSSLSAAAEFSDALKRQWPGTDFTRYSVEPREVLSGGPPKDGIPPVDAPVFEDVEKAGKWLHPDEPVIAAHIAGQARAYPLQILIWHEIVNDTVGEVPVSVTFCPLCNASIVFDRRFAGTVLDFGTTGLLRHSDLIMYDRQTQSWWQQFTGESIVGELTGGKLERVASSIVSFRAFADTYPEGRVLSRNTGARRPYGQNPYPGYDDINSSPFLFPGAVDGRLPPMERVLGIRIGGSSRIYPFSRIEPGAVIEGQIGDTPYLVAHTGALLSALDERDISASLRVAEVVAWQRRTGSDTQVLSFFRNGEKLEDRETGSTWNALGIAIAGPLEGSRLLPLDSGVHFAFAWLAFDPSTEIWRPGE